MIPNLGAKMAIFEDMDNGFKMQRIKGASVRGKTIFRMKVLGEDLVKRSLKKKKFHKGERELSITKKRRKNRKEGERDGK